MALSGGWLSFKKKAQQKKKKKKKKKKPKFRDRRQEGASGWLSRMMRLG